MDGCVTSASVPGSAPAMVCGNCEHFVREERFFGGSYGGACLRTRPDWDRSKMMRTTSTFRACEFHDETTDDN